MKFFHNGPIEERLIKRTRDSVEIGLTSGEAICQELTLTKDDLRYLLGNEWRPISTAPRSFKEPIVLLLNDGNCTVGWWYDGFFGGRWMFWGDTEGLKRSKPTHWAPLPSREFF